MPKERNRMRYEKDQEQPLYEQAIVESIKTRF